MKLNLDGKVFRSVTNTRNGEVTSETLFHYHQHDEIVSAEYSGGTIVLGHLLGIVRANGLLEIRYHHINRKGEFMLGKAISTPGLLPDGRIKLAEDWQWLGGDCSSGQSEIEEVR